MHLKTKKGPFIDFLYKNIYLFQKFIKKEVCKVEDNVMCTFNYTSLPLLRKKSISSDVKLVIDIDFTRCGGLSPRLKKIKFIMVKLFWKVKIP